MFFTVSTITEKVFVPDTETIMIDTPTVKDDKMEASISNGK